MSFDLIAYEPLKNQIKESIKQLIEHHDKTFHIESNDLEKSVNGALSGPRQVQSLVLLKTIDLLDTSILASNKTKPSADTLDQARILNAMAFYIRSQIEATYTKTSPENSKLYQLLTTSLGINIVNKPDNSDLLEMYNPLRGFIRSHVYNKDPDKARGKPDPRNGRLANQPFAIEGFEVTDVLIDLNHKIVNMDDNFIKEDKALADKANKANRSTGIFGGIFGSGSSKPKNKGSGQDTGITLGSQ